MTKQYMQNRELSWLRFNQRVLEEAQDETVPLGERLKFVTIFTSNLDEFFMIRVGSLYDMVMLGDEAKDNKSGLSAAQQLERIYPRVGTLIAMRDEIYQHINEELGHYGISELSMKDLDSREAKQIKAYFREQILPVLSPQIVDGNHPFPHLQNKMIYVVANLQSKDKHMMGVVPVPSFVSEIVYLPGDEIRYLRMEKIIQEYLELVFDKYTVTDKNYLCVTRNADISPDDEVVDVDDDFRIRMKKLLHKRRRMAVVRLECAEKLEKSMQEMLCKKCSIQPMQIFVTQSPMKMDYAYGVIAKIPGPLQKTLLYPPFSPQKSPQVEPGSMIRQVRRHDILLSYPFESMEPFLRLIKEAANDPSVLTIKITIYRLAKKARLVEYLCAAAENGKEVTVVIELRARFDEQNNIDWSERLEDAGCRVIYGFENYKVHSKICLITMKNKNGISHITQIGTGNYNEKTAEMYTDLSLITADPAIGEDAVNFFKNMSIGNLRGSYSHLLVSPVSLKSTILQAIEGETVKGSAGRIIMKMNSITDYDVIVKLAEASRAGVKIDLIVRGICCILPGIEGHTENITVTSIVGRFLEHSRIFCFGTGNARRYFIGSADMMTRNTERRVEIACPVYDKNIQTRLDHMLTIFLTDTVKARRLRNDGVYEKKISQDTPLSSQDYFMQEALEQAPRWTAPSPTGGWWSRWKEKLFHRR